MAFELPKSSVDRLAEVHVDLRRVVLLAAQRSPLRFVVTEGRRTMEKQRHMVAIGASKTLLGRHVAENNQCGLSCAVDLGAWIDADGDGSVDNGEIRWDGGLYFELAYAMQDAAVDLNIPVVWGGAWCSLLGQRSLEEAQADYVARKRAKGERPLIDGPHFELDKKVYP